MYSDCSDDTPDAGSLPSPEATVCPSLVLYGDIAARAVQSKSADPQGTSALFTIGWMYYFGLGGCAVNKKKAYAYFYEAAERSDPLARYYVGLQQLAGDGTRRDSAAGLGSLLLAADEGGLDVAMYAAGKLLLSGSTDGTVSADRPRGVKLIEMAEQLRNVPAMNKMMELRREQRVTEEPTKAT